MYRFSLRALSLSLIVIGLMGCWKPTTPANPVPETVPSKTYTLRLVFDGLVTFWEPNKSSKPGAFWVLVGNASDPSQLDVGKNMPPHKAELLVNDDAHVKIWGRAVSSAIDMSHHPPHPPIDGLWRMVDLQNEDLSIVARTSTPLTVTRGVAKLPEPCTVGEGGCTEERSASERSDLLWTVDFNEILSFVKEGTSWDKSIKNCLLDDRYSCRDSYTLLAGRLKFVNGRVFVKKLATADDFIVQYRLEPKVGNFVSRAQAAEVAVEFDIDGPDPVEFRSKPLGSRGEQQKSLFVQGEPGHVVEVRIGNHPIYSKDQILAKKLTDRDFLFNLNLLNNPKFLEPSRMPAPVAVDEATFPNWNAQCSPASYTGNGG